jgi:hypothetical protein
MVTMEDPTMGEDQQIIVKTMIMMTNNPNNQINLTAMVTITMVDLITMGSLLVAMDGQTIMEITEDPTIMKIMDGQTIMEITEDPTIMKIMEGLTIMETMEDPTTTADLIITTTRTTEKIMATAIRKMVIITMEVIMGVETKTKEVATIKMSVAQEDAVAVLEGVEEANGVGANVKVEAVLATETASRSEREEAVNVARTGAEASRETESANLNLFMNFGDGF